MCYKDNFPRRQNEFFAKYFHETSNLIYTIVTSLLSLEFKNLDHRRIVIFRELISSLDNHGDHSQLQIK